MLKMYFRKHEFIYSSCETVTKNKGRIQRFKETGHSRSIKGN